MHPSLNLVQQRLALLAVALLRLLAEQLVDVGVAARGVRRAADHEGLEANGSAAGRRRDRHDNTAELLRAPCLHEGGPLHAALPRANAHCGKLGRHRLPHGGERRKRRQVSCVEAGGKAGVGEETLGVRRIIGIRIEAEREFHAARNHGSRQARVSQSLCLVDGLLVDGQIGREPDAAIVPR